MYAIPFLDIPALKGVSGRIRLPGSKSISNRVLLLAALARGRTTIHGLLESDDTRVMLDALGQLGCDIRQEGEQTLIEGWSGGQPRSAGDLFLGNAGTAMRPLVAVLALLGGNHTLSGTPRMHERPIGDLVDALAALGCRVEYLGTPGYPPLRIGAPTLQLDRPITIRGDVSSQFLTALLLALPALAPTCPHDLEIRVAGTLISKPYVALTLALLARFGVHVRRDGWRRFIIPRDSRLQSPGTIHVEADASSASYFIAAAAISDQPGDAGLVIDGIDAGSIQGDVAFIDAARQMGALIESSDQQLLVRRGRCPLRAIDLDCNAIPDAAMTLAMMALYADAPSTLRNIASWRVKETDRLAAMASELRKLGASVEEGGDFLRITPPAAAAWRAATWRTYDDHRMAMCGSLAAFNPARHPIRIEDPACVGKTFPDYFERLFGVAEAFTGVPVICIDGPSASGKGTLASALAQRLGYHYLDSGALYRLTGLAARHRNLLPFAEHGPDIAQLAAALPARFEGQRIWLDDEEVTEIVRTEEAGADASAVASMPAVREALLDLQRRSARLPGLVADGRDMGTVVFPDARLKVFLTASVDERARRRQEQLRALGKAARIERLLMDLAARDARDRARAASPLKSAEDALPLDNSHLSAEQSVQRVLDWWQSRQPFDTA